MNGGGLRKTRCASNPAHVVGSRKCKECNERAQALCKLCGNWKASAGIADHENRCREKKKNEESDAIRVAYVAPTMERGRYFFENEEQFRVSANWLGRRDVDDGIIGGYTVNSYDAVFAQLEETRAIQVVRCFKDSASIIRLIKERKSLDVRILIWPNWMFESGSADLASLVEWVEQLRQYECVCKCKLFPPIDYCVLFGRKELWTSRMLLQNDSSLWKMIPTHLVFDEWKGKEAGVKSFAKDHGTNRLVFKRSLSEASEHVYDHVVVGKRLKGVPTDMGPFPYLVQPFIEEFEQHPEMRIYVLNGDFFFGVQTRWIDGLIDFKALEDCNHAAIKAALAVVRAIPEARNFARVDLVESNQDKDRWWLNEIEFFGSADLLFPVAGGQRELLVKLAEAIKKLL